jgi:diguanylate cyclase (GGDEF)-like protein
MGSQQPKLPGVRNPAVHPRLNWAASLVGPLFLVPLVLLHWRTPAGAIWVRFVVLGLAATVSSWQSAPWHMIRRNERFTGAVIDLSDVFIIGAVFLLPAPLAAIVSGGSFLMTWARDDVPLYKIAFNVSMYITCGGLAWMVFHALPRHANGPWLLAAAAASLVFLVVNMLGSLLARYVMRGIPVTSWQDLLYRAYPWLEQVMCAGCAVLIAALWRLAPVFEVLALLPLTTLYRVLWFREVETASRSDGKTGLFNSNYFTRTSKVEIARALRNDYPLTLIMCDLDHLRRVNNSRGHLAGDAAIVLASHVIRDNVREVDIPCRFGGEEFAVLLPHAGMDEALQIAERLRAEIADAWPKDPRTGEAFQITTSVGVAALDPDDPALQTLMQRADDALYAAKHAGRNCVQAARVEQPV